MSNPISTHLEKVLAENHYKKENWQISVVGANINLFKRGKKIVWEVDADEALSDFENDEKSLTNFFNELKKTYTSFKNLGTIPSVIVFHGGGDSEIPIDLLTFIRYRRTEIIIFTIEEDWKLTRHLEYIYRKRKL